MKKYIDLDDMANVNSSNVLNIIQKNGNVSRKQITELSGLSWGGMTKIVNRLLENGYITETKPKGRAAGALSVNTSKNFVVGLDINKTGLNAIVMNLAGDILKSMSEDVKSNTKEELICEIISFLEIVFSFFDKGSIISIGVAMQGIVDSKRGISVHFPDIPDWHNVSLADIIGNRFGVKVFLEHDPDCLLYTQLSDGNKKNTILLRIDKSIGMAVAIDGKIIKGKGIFEIAHNTVVPNDKPCSCGKCGCLEAYISPCMEKGAVNQKAIDELIYPLSVEINNLINIFNAERVVLTGKLMEYKNEITNSIKEHINSKSTQICSFETLDNAVRGASLIAVNRSINSIII